MKKIAKTLLLAGILSCSITLAACNGGGEGGDTGGDPTVIFRLNYKSGDADVFKQVTVKKGEYVDEPKEVPERDGYIFDRWHDDQDKESEFDFEEPIKKNTKIYAHWLARLECTFDLNYTGAPAAQKVEVIQKSAVNRPDDPTRDGYQFVGWTRAKDSDEIYDFARPFSENTTLYAKWGAVGSPKIYKFEAEYCDVITKGMGMGGATYSGGQTGKGLIHIDDTNDSKASNGCFVHFLYVNGNNLTFEINSDEAGSAKINMSLSYEYKDAFSISPTGGEGVSKYTIKVNGVAMNYEQIDFTKDPAENGEWNDFKEYVLAANVDLVKGKNTVEMITDNNDLLYGTAQATAPMIDCLSFETSQNLKWLNAKGSQIL